MCIRDRYNRINLTPIWDNEQEYDYVMWGNWPTGQDQYTEWGAYMNDYPEWAEKNGVTSQAVGECKSTSSMRFHSVLRLRIPMEERDERIFTDSRTCKLTDDADISELKEAISNHVVTAVKKLRSQRSLCGCICVFIQTNKFRVQELQYKNAYEISFSEPTQNTFKLLKASDQALKVIYRSKFKYQKAGVMLSQLINNNKSVDLLERPQFNIQSDLFSSFMQDNKKEYKRAKFADVVDQINNKLGKSIIIYGAQGIQKEPVRFNAVGSNWQMKSYYRSPAYTTRWDELLKVF